MIGPEPHGKRLKQTLPAPNERHRATDVLKHQQLTTRAQDAQRLVGRGRGIWDRAEAKRAGHCVEAGVVELERLGVAELKLRGMAQPSRELAADREHRWAQLYAGQLRLLWIEGQV